eukprot:4131614-Amphidinium_carterae.1
MSSTSGNNEEAPRMAKRALPDKVSSGDLLQVGRAFAAEIWDSIPSFIRDLATTYAYYSTDWLLFLVLSEVMPSQDLGQVSIQDELEKYPNPVSSFEAVVEWGEKRLTAFSRQNGMRYCKERRSKSGQCRDLLERIRVVAVVEPLLQILPMMLRAAGLTPVVVLE